LRVINRLPHIWLLVLCFALVDPIGNISAVGAKHDFEGKCRLCHSSIPKRGTDFSRIVLNGEPEQLCLQCHKINQRTSHPVDVAPKGPMPLSKFLDKQGRITCLTCHQVHKERNTSSWGNTELKGLLRGHANGRAFCIMCHSNDALGAKWHAGVVNYAHTPGKFIQTSGGGQLLDQNSIECLSCHDGSVSQATSVSMNSGSFQHGSGSSHPVGVDYPKPGMKAGFEPAQALPEEVALFQGKIGCLTCHNPYEKNKKLLVKDNSRAALCLSCHRK